MDGNLPTFRILNNPAVIGEFQPHKIVDGKRKPDGEPIKGYFPAIIDEELFYRAQAGRIQRRLHGGGRKGKDVANLFSGVAKCAYCKSTMVFENKGQGSRGGSFLVCDRSKRGLGCNSGRWRYSDFEQSFLAFVQELDLERIVEAEDETHVRANLTASMEAIRGELAEIEERMARLCDLYETGEGAKDFVAARLSALENRSLDLKTDLKRKEDEYVALRTNFSSQEANEQMKDLISRVQRGEGRENYKLRAQIAANVKSLVSILLVAPRGSSPITTRAQQILASEDRDFFSVTCSITCELSADDPKSKRRYFVAGFRDHGMRAVYPTDIDPLQFEQQIFTKPEGLIRVDGTGEPRFP